MIEDTISIITKHGFFNNEVRTFKRDQVKVKTLHTISSCSACNPMGDMLEIETKNGEIIRGNKSYD